jgi:hypothetical protein
MRRGLRPLIGGGLLGAMALLVACSEQRPAGADEVAVIRPGVETGFSNGGWNLDRYPGLEPLNAGARIVVADLPGPGIIRHIHLTRHHPAEFFARGIVLEIWFDDAAMPAVMSPLADFFGDGGNGRAADFSADLVECAPWSYNAYFVMPFRTRARVVLRNDTDRDAVDYSYVEWERIPRWDGRFGYFHATFERRAFRLLPDTSELFFEVRGSGHLLGRQFSVTTDDSLFRDFYYVMEGNNEVAIDGRERALDYLGTEDSFTFSWGFRKTFAGRSAGMPLVEPGEKGSPASLSIFRFHDRMPIRFRRSLSWRINWGEERHMHASKAFQDGIARYSDDPERLWVDYATVFYWYQDEPGGYAHVPLEAAAARRALMRHPNRVPRPEQP